MTTRHAIFACAGLILAGAGSPAMATEQWHRDHGAYWRATHNAIYELDKGIAFLEADPEADDGYKARVISKERADIRRLRATLPPAQWRWVTPCCYSRRPIYIR